MSARLRSDFWVSAYLRRCHHDTVAAVLRRRGASEAGAILVKVDNLDGMAALYGPAPQSEVEDRDAERGFARLHDPDLLPVADIERRIARQIDFDPDIWVIEVEDRLGRSRLD